MSKFRVHGWWLVTAFLTTSLIAVAVPNSFRSGDVISSALVNANFTDLETRVRALELAARSTPTVRTSAVATINASDFASATVACAAGEVLTGGGCSYLTYAGGVGDQNLVASGPFTATGPSLNPFPSSYAVNSATGGNSWMCVVEETQGVTGNTFQAFAVCSTR